MLATRLAALALAASSTAFVAQSAAPPAPVSPISVEYRYWPEQFVQWGSSDYPYSMMELNVDFTHGHKLMDFVLQSKDGKRVHYVNDPSLVTEGKVFGDDPQLAKMQLDRPDAPGPNATYTFRAVLPDNTPVQWRFITVSEVMERGGGVTPLPNIPVPVFAYRETSTVAAEGTAIAIGKQAEQAEPWTEISHPPYFVAYHGAYTNDAHTLVFHAGKEDWHVDAAPQSIKTGAAWKLSKDGRSMTYTIKKMEGNKATIAVDDSALPRLTTTLSATSTDKGWLFESVHFVPNDEEKQAMTIQVENGSLKVIVGKKTTIAEASVEQTPAAATVTFKSPDWVKGKGTRGAVGTADNTLTLAIAPLSK